MLRFLRHLMVVWLLWGIASQEGVVASEPHVEFRLSTETVHGRLVAHDQQHGWVLDPGGRLTLVDFSKVTAKKKLAAPFRPSNIPSLRDRLQREFGSEYEVTSTPHYVVCAGPGRARNYAKLLDEVYRDIYMYFRIRGMRVAAPEFPLVAVIFPNQREFVEYLREDGLQPVPGLLGYYLRTSNRIAFFESANTVSDTSSYNPNPVSVAVGDVFMGSQREHWSGSFQIERPRGETLQQAWNSTRGSLLDTLIHEATHQIGFNTGLHLRLGDNPRWVVEGLAMVFESSGIRNRSAQLKSRVNRERFVHFLAQISAERTVPIAEFITDDRPFQTSVLDAYAQAWALSFYLLETRPRLFQQYLHMMSRRPPLVRYSGAERLRDFRTTFGDNLAWLDAEFLRYMKRLN